MTQGGIKEATTFSIAIGPAASDGVEGEMARVSIASLFEGAGSPVIADSPGDGGSDLTVGRHGMIADLYSSGSQSSVALDFGLAVRPSPVSIDGVVRHDAFDALSGGDVFAPVAALLQGEAGPGGIPLGFGDEVRVPDDAHAPIAGQSMLAAIAPALSLAPADALSTMGNPDFGRHELPMPFDNDALPLPISEHHIIA